jgi:hypothetical protein
MPNENGQDARSLSVPFMALLIEDVIAARQRLNDCRSALSWLVAIVERVMSGTNLTLARHDRDFRETVRRLQAGDPDAFRVSRSTLASGCGGVTSHHP